MYFQKGAENVRNLEGLFELILQHPPMSKWSCRKTFPLFCLYLCYWV